LHRRAKELWLPAIFIAFWIAVIMRTTIQPKIDNCQQLKYAYIYNTLQPMVANIDQSKADFSARLDRALTYAGVPPSRGRLSCVAKMFGVSREASRKWLAGESIPDTKRISDIARLTGVKGEWLLTGQGSMRPGEMSDDEEGGNKGVHPYILQLAHLIAEAPIDKVQAILLLLGVEGKNATQFITAAHRDKYGPNQEDGSPIEERRQQPENRRQNVQEVDFERRSGFDRRDERAYIFNKDGKGTRKDKDDQGNEGGNHGTAS
jgi:hypothetical protein